MPWISPPRSSAPPRRRTRSTPRWRSSPTGAVASSSCSTIRTPWASVRTSPIRRSCGRPVDHAAATCVTVDLEAGYSGRDITDVRTIADRRRALYVVLPISETIAERARDVQLRMAARGHHRAAGVVDLLTAAIAEHHGAVV